MNRNTVPIRRGYVAPSSVRVDATGTKADEPYDREKQWWLRAVAKAYNADPVTSSSKVRQWMREHLGA